MNAIILAAGRGRRLDELTADLPKPLIVINDLPLIERQIIYLHEKNIKDIYVVVGYQKEKFYYLKDKYQVKLIINDLYAQYNNLYSLYLAGEYLNDSYIIEGDIFLDKNIFYKNINHSTYFTSYRQNFEREWVINGENGYVDSISIREGSGDVIAGISFWDKESCSLIKKTMLEFIESECFFNMFWGEVILECLKSLKIKIEKIGYNDIYEIDNIKDYYTLKYMVEIKDHRDVYEGLLDKVKVVELRMLRIFDDICKRHKINYWLGGGTLLGAYRHKGFIPWDDDIDVVMNRPDYEKFLIVAQDELPHDLFVQCYLTDRKYRFNARIRDAYSSCKTVYEMSDLSHKGLYLDIFPFDFYKTKPKHIKYISRFATTVFSDVRPIREVKLESITRFKWFYKISYVLLRLPSLLLSDQTMIKLFSLYRKLFTTKKQTDVFYKGLECCFDKFRVVHYDTVFPLNEITFEGYEFSCPARIDFYLKELYGSYMTLPSKKEQKGAQHYIELDLYKPCLHKKSMQWIKRGYHD